ncbi:hypothetical protein G9A89_006159 [Geosiphon pyriformis]|nr:hypothetical protein G9A89_006159 [Geosiphon pyriformis]
MPRGIHTKSSGDFFEVERILDERVQKGERQYLCQWKGIDPQTNLPWAPTWEPKKNCTKALLREWNKTKNHIDMDGHQSENDEFHHGQIYEEVPDVMDDASTIAGSPKTTDSRESTKAPSVTSQSASLPDLSISLDQRAPLTEKKQGQVENRWPKYYNFPGVILPVKNNFEKPCIPRVHDRSNLDPNSNVIEISDSEDEELISSSQNSLPLAHNINIPMMVDTEVESQTSSIGHQALISRGVNGDSSSINMGGNNGGPSRQLSNNQSPQKPQHFNIFGVKDTNKGKEPATASTSMISFQTKGQYPIKKNFFMIPVPMSYSQRRLYVQLLNDRSVAQQLESSSLTETVDLNTPIHKKLIQFNDLLDNPSLFLSSMEAATHMFSSSDEAGKLTTLRLLLPSINPGIIYAIVVRPEIMELMKTFLAHIQIPYREFGAMSNQNIQPSQNGENFGLHLFTADYIENSRNLPPFDFVIAYDSSFDLCKLWLHSEHHMELPILRLVTKNSSEQAYIYMLQMSDDSSLRNLRLIDLKRIHDFGIKVECGYIKVGWQKNELELKEVVKKVIEWIQSNYQTNLNFGMEEEVKKCLQKIVIPIVPRILRPNFNQVNQMQIYQSSQRQNLPNFNQPLLAVEPNIRPSEDEGSMNSIGDKRKESGRNKESVNESENKAKRAKTQFPSHPDDQSTIQVSSSTLASTESLLHPISPADNDPIKTLKQLLNKTLKELEENKKELAKKSIELSKSEMEIQKLRAQEQDAAKKSDQEKQQLKNKERKATVELRKAHEIINRMKEEAGETQQELLKARRAAATSRPPSSALKHSELHERIRHLEVLNQNLKDDKQYFNLTGLMLQEQNRLSDDLIRRMWAEKIKANMESLATPPSDNGGTSITRSSLGFPTALSLETEAFVCEWTLDDERQCGKPYETKEALQAHVRAIHCGVPSFIMKRDRLVSTNVPAPST